MITKNLNLVLDATICDSSVELFDKLIRLATYR